MSTAFDIAHCANKECPLKDTCLRYTDAQGRNERIAEDQRVFNPA